MDVETLLLKLNRINIIAEFLVDLLPGNKLAMVLTEIIIETSTMPEA